MLILKAQASSLAELISGLDFDPRMGVISRKSGAMIGICLDGREREKTYPRGESSKYGTDFFLHFCFSPA
jgi:hypothetical protein